MSPDPYAVLGVDPDATDAELKAAWRARLQTHHPDRAWQEGDAAVEAAEDAAKHINAAYAEIKRRRARGESPAPGAPGRATRVRRRPAQPEAPVDARDALRRAQVAVAYADTLCARWKRHAASLRAARKGAIEAHATADAAATAVAALRLAALAERDALTAALAAAAAALAEVPAAPAKAAARRATTITIDPAAIDPAAVVARAHALHPIARRRAEAATALAGQCNRHLPIAASAAGRGRDAHTRARRAVDQLNTAVADAAKAVQRAIIAAATAGGICDVDRRQAADETDRFIATRACTEAGQYRDEAAQLERDQQQVIAAVAAVPERLAEIRGLIERAEQAARDAQRDAEAAAAAAAEARALADGVAADLLARLEATVTAAAPLA